MGEQLVRADQTAVAHAKGLEELRDRLVAIQGAAKESLDKVTGEVKAMTGEFGKRLDHLAERLATSDGAARDRDSSLDKITGRLETVEGALEEATRLTSTEIQEMERDLQDFRVEIRGALRRDGKRTAVK
jgi:hypothetical protein